MSEPDARSYSTTAFKGGLVAWLGAITMLVAAPDPTVRLIGAVGIVALPALFILCNAYVKRRAGGAGGGGLLGSLMPLLGALQPPVSTAAPAAAPPVPELIPCATCDSKGVVGDINKPEERKPCPDCAGTGLALK